MKLRIQCCLAGLALVMLVAAAPVPDSDIATLKTELAGAGNGKTAVEQRMACKSAIQQGKALLKAHPDAPNRFRVLGIILQTQKRLFGLEDSDRNRSELFETSELLAKAPDEYAELRLQADLLLSERDLAAKDASLQERAEALTAIVERYRDTPAEAKSLMMAAMIAPKLEANELEDEVFEKLNQRFADDPVVIEFMQKNLRIGSLDVVFSGTFTRADGTVLRFPSDRLGHDSLMVFWSKETPNFEAFLNQVKEQQGLYANILEVYSFNADEMPDAGEAILRKLGLDWTVLRLPGGRKNQVFQTYAQKDPVGIHVNAYGHAVLTPAVMSPNKFVIPDAQISHARYLAQLQSLFIGDFLVPNSEHSFTPPFRYRLTMAEALAHYTKTEQQPQSTDPVIARNQRIIALLGMWNLTGDPKHLNQAVEESRTALKSDLPAAAGVVPRFCLAKQTLREGSAKPEAVLAGLIQESGGDSAPASAFAAAAILALEAQSRELHEQYRSKFMGAPYDSEPALWSFVSFLRDRYHRYYLLQGNAVDKRAARAYVVNHGGRPTTDRLPAIELKTLDGKTLTLPKDTNGKLTLLVFIEPPAVIKEEPELDAKGKPKKKERHSAIMDYALNLADRHIHKELNVVTAFLCDDPGKVQAMMKKEEWNCQPVMVPGGLANPMVQRLGILSADCIPNVFLLRRDGTIEWQTSGLRYKTSFAGEFAIYLAMKVHTEVCETETGYEALQQGDFKRAASIFSGPFLPERDERFQWAGPRFHGRALAHLGLKEWDAALADIDVAIAAHHKSDAKTGPCEIMAEMRHIRATILDQLGRKEEAQAERKLTDAPTTPHRPTPYEVFQAKLTAFRREQWK